MDMNDMIMISSDDHIIEPENVFEGRMPAKYRDDAPKLVRTASGVDHWEFAGQNTGAVGVTAVASWPKSEWGNDPVGHSEMRPACYDVNERVRDMDANGMLGSLCFPTMAGFSGHYLANVPDQGLAAAAITAYNDWHIDEWCATAPGRFIPLAVLPLFDVAASVAEIHRLAAKGCTAIAMPEVPYLIDLPSFQSDYWNPIFKAISDYSMVICLHIGMSIRIIPNPGGADPGRVIIMGAQMSAMVLNDLMTFGVFKRFPKLKVALSEGGIGWVPFYLDRADRHVQEHAWTDVAAKSGVELPSDLLKENILACFITDASTLRIRDRIGIQAISWECDYPHTDSTWPKSPELLFKELADAQCTDDEIHAITWGNSARFFNFDPFKYRTKEQATVGALRANAAAAHVDTSETSKSVYRARWDEKMKVGANA